MRSKWIRVVVLVMLMLALVPAGQELAGAHSALLSSNHQLPELGGADSENTPLSIGNAQVVVTSSPTPNAGCSNVQPLPPLPLPQEQYAQAAVQQALDAHNDHRAISATFTVLSIGGKDDWAIAECVPALQQDSLGGTEGVLVLLRKIEDAWHAALPGDSVYVSWLEQVPSRYLSRAVREQMEQLNLVAPEAIDPSDGIYRLPYANGASVYVARDSNEHGGPIDFWSANGSVVAAMDGWVEGFYDDHTECCCNSACHSCNNWIELRHANGEHTHYHHIATNSVRVSIDQWVPAGTVIATQSDVGWSCGVGRAETGCGSFNQDNPNNDCAVHLHFAVTDGGAVRKPRFCDGSGGWFYPADAHSYAAQSCPGSSNQPPNPPRLENPNNGVWLGSRRVTLSWRDGGDPDNGPRDYRKYYVRVWGSGWSKTLNWTANTSWQVTVPSNGSYSWRVRADDGAATSAWSGTRTFNIDASPPNEPSVFISGSGCTGIPNNDWQNTCYDPAFTWSATDAGGSGVAEYAYAWGTSSSANPSNWSDATSYDPGPIAPPDGSARYYLHVRARDALGNPSSPSTYGIWYDGTVPTVTLSINNGASTTNQANVHLNLSAGDTGSGVAEVRISNNGLTWSDWQPYADVIPWTLPALDRRELPVYVQVRDRAGNESVIASDTIYLDLYPPMPHSANYRICQDVINVGGSVGVTSTSYSLISAIGQPWASGADPNASASFSGHAGFLSSLSGCLPITRAWTNNYTVTQSVVASGGNLRGSASFRLGDTTGQPAASGTNAFSSTNYVLSSGFWAAITGTVPTTSTPPTPPPVTITPTLTPTPSPTPTPQPGSFGVTIDDGALFTNDPLVTVRLWGPNVTQMRLSNDGGFTDSYWRSYQITTTWPISTYGNYVMPRLVYAQFQDAQGSIYGTFMDDIIYDPVAPEGEVYLLWSDIPTTTLSLEAWDDNSGVSEMRVADTLGGIDAASWQPYTETLSWVLQGSQVYAQFRDHAGNPSSIYDSNGIEHPLNASYIYLPLVVRND